MSRQHGPLPTELYTAAACRDLDRSAIDGHAIPGYTLMQRAGQAAFRVLLERWPRARRLAVVCGTGNNAGDGFVLARLARAHGLEVRLLQVGDGARLRGDAGTAAAAWRGSGGRSEAFAADGLAGAEVLVDALFGTGLERPVEGAWAEAVAAINATGVPVLALDVPSGLDADRGVALGVAVRAAATVSFIGLKRGLFTGQGPEHAGHVHCAGLEVPPAVYAAVPASAQLLGDALLALLPRRRRDAHKGRHGHLLVLGGDHGMAGASLLAATAALRCGAGLVSLATRPEHAAALTAAQPELMCHGVATPRELRPLLQRADAVVAGPGLGRGAWGAALLGAARDAGRPLLLDADALTLLASDPAADDGWILTPHPGEAGRLLGSDAAAVQADRFAALAALRARYAGTLVLKGAGTLVDDGHGLPAVCAEGNPGMAVGGMGDVLSGVIGALRVQGLAPGDAARLGVLLHARAGDSAARDGERGLLPSDLLGPLRHLVNPG
ncbi:MAG TPA: NAD(P)H-hydrate dehydratase [Gammaproteobacteria bacterium]